MSKFLLLHLSDLHFDPTRARDRKFVIDALLKDLVQLKRDGKSPDAVVFSGDLIHDADIEGSFEGAKKDSLDPLLQAFELPTNRLFLAPGNHDIQRSAIDEYSEDGMRHLLSDREKVNTCIDSMGSKPYLLNRLHLFNDFATSLFGTTGPLDSLFRATTVQLGSVDVGVAVLNTAWRATGRPENADRGKLLLGERQVDLAIETIAKADVKVAVFHHPWEWLTDFDMRDAQLRLVANFDIVLNGHNHFAAPVSLLTTAGAAFINGSGCLYQSRDYFNGYSLIQCDLGAKRGRVSLRRYYDDRREFDVDLDHSTQSDFDFPLAISSMKAEFLSKAHHIYGVTTEMVTLANAQLISSAADTAAPKDISSIFVEPPIGTHPEFRRGDPNKPGDDPAFARLSDLILGGKSLVFAGPSGSGRTTLLNYIAISMADAKFASVARIPFLVRFASIGSGTKPVERAIRAASCELSRRCSQVRGGCPSGPDSERLVVSKPLADTRRTPDGHPQECPKLPGKSTASDPKSSRGGDARGRGRGHGRHESA